MVCHYLQKIEGRAMTDIRTSLQHNSQAQRRAQEDAEHLVREAKRQQMIDKVEVIYSIYKFLYIVLTILLCMIMQYEVIKS